VIHTRTTYRTANRSRSPMSSRAAAERCAYRAEQRVVNGVDELSVDPRVVHGVKGSVRLSLGKGWRREDRNGGKKRRRERQEKKRMKEKMLSTS